MPTAFVAPAPVARSGIRARHVLVALSFLALVAGPLGLAADYLWTRAADQYASRVGFSVRQTQAAPVPSLSALAGLAGLGVLSGSAAEDGNILNEYLRSQDIVALVDAKLDLRRLWSLPGADRDPVFAYHAPGTIEDLHAYWQRMVGVLYDPGRGLVSVEVRAFRPDDARTIAAAVFEAASDRVNALSEIARDDTIRLARLDLDEAEARLARARAALTGFRDRTRVVDPAASLQGQMGLLTTLQAQLAEAMIQHDMLDGTTGEDDPRLTRLRRQIEVIEARIEGETAKLGGGGAAYATLVGEFERLTVEQRFAEEAYVAALAALDLARAEARRQTRYLAAHVPPTLAEAAEYPRRLRLMGILGVFLMLGWTLAVVTAYSLRDRR